MDIRVLLRPEHVLLGVVENDRAALFRLLMGPLVEDGVITDGDRFLDDLLRRECQVTTQMPGGVAFPHACSPAVTRLGLIVGTCPPPGVVFDPLQEERCRILFMLAVPATAPTAHLPLLNLLANLVRQENKKARLLRARSAGAVTRVIRTFKG